MELYIYTPAFPLNKFVKSIIYYSGYTALSKYESLLPDGNSQLIIELDEHARFLKRHSNSTPQQCNTSWFTGIQYEPLTYLGEVNATTMCIQFQQGTLFNLFNIPADELFNQVVPSEFIAKQDLNELRNQLLELNDAASRINLICMYFSNKISHTSPLSPFLSLTLSELKRPEKSIKDIANKVGYSNKHFTHVFKKEIGLSPKKFQRLSRFNQVLQALHTSQRPNYLDLCHDHFYYDQAHYINEFKYFSGKTPLQYEKAKGEYPHVLYSNE